MRVQTTALRAECAQKARALIEQWQGRAFSRSFADNPDILLLAEMIANLLQAEIRRASALPASIQEALNSGDGTYRP